MSMTVWVGLVAAASNPLESIARHFSRSLPQKHYLLGLVGLLAVCLGWFIATRLYQRRLQAEAPNNPGPLFEELCRTHGLSPEERDLLTRMARHAQTTAAVFFVAPSLFDRTAEALLADPSGADVEFFDQLQSLRAKLFEGL